MAPPPTAPPVHTLRIRVRYCDVDRMGYLWHGHFLAYFEEGRTAWLRGRGASYRELEDAGVLLVVVDAGLSFRRPATYDDEVEVHTRLTEVGGATLRFDYEARRGADLLAVGHTRLASCDRRGRPRRLPEALAALAEAALAPGGTTPGSGAVQGGTEAPRA